MKDNRNERQVTDMEMEREEILAGIINDFRIGLDETNSVKLETGNVLLQGISNERELVDYYLNEINPFINDEAGLSYELWGPRIADRIGGSFTKQGYVLDLANLEKEKSEPVLNVIAEGKPEGKYGGMSINEICKELNCHPETTNLVSWFGDYALYEPALNVSDEEIYKAYDEILQKEKTFGKETEQEFDLER